jgi:hypothetical protein
MWRTGLGVDKKKILPQNIPMGHVALMGTDTPNHRFSLFGTVASGTTGVVKSLAAEHQGSFSLTLGGPRVPLGQGEG